MKFSLLIKKANLSTLVFFLEVPPHLPLIRMLAFFFVSPLLLLIIHQLTGGHDGNCSCKVVQMPRILS